MPSRRPRGSMGSRMYRRTSSRSDPATEEPLHLHQLVHQRLWTTMNVLGPGPEDKPDPGQIAGSRGALAVTTEQNALSPSPVRSQRHVRELRWDRGLIFGLIRLGSPTFIVTGQLLGGVAG